MFQMVTKNPIEGSLEKYSKKYSAPRFNPTKDRESNGEEKRQQLPTIPGNWDTVKNPQSGRGVNTYSYFKTKDCMSSGQKAIRRCLVRESQQWFLELVLTGPQQEVSVFNKLEEITFEDIGIANPLAILQVRRNKVLGDHLRIMTTISKLAQSEKSRINRITLYTFIDERGSKQEPEEIMQMLELYIINKDRIQALKYLTKLYFCKGKILSGKFKLPHEGPWKIFYKIILGETPPPIKNSARNYMDVLYKIHHTDHWWGSDKKKGFLIVLQILHLYMLDMLENVMKFNVASMKKDIDENYLETLEEIYEGNKLVGVPDYALVTSTSKGKYTKQHFYEEGSRITNANEKFSAYEDEYLELLED